MSLIFKKIPQIMRSLGAIEKSRVNQHQNYRFRGIEDCYTALHPLLSENGVFCAPEVVDFQTSVIESRKNDEVRFTHKTLLKIRHRFYAEDGSFVDVTTMGEALDTSDKASNKAMSAAMKYAFIELFSIPTSDIDDSDRDHVQMSTEAKFDKPVFNPHPRTPMDQVICPAGRNKGKYAREIPPQDLSSDLSYWQQRLNQSGEVAKGSLAEYLEAAKFYVSQGGTK